MSKRFGEPELVGEWDDVVWSDGLNAFIPIRIYRTRREDADGSFQFYRYHFGWPKEHFKAIRVIISTTPYWGTDCWTEDDDFLIWWTSTCEKSEDVPYDDLQRDLGFFLAQYRLCIRLFMSKGGKDAKTS